MPKPKPAVAPTEPIPEVQPFTKAAQTKGRKPKAQAPPPAPATSIPEPAAPVEPAPTPEPVATPTPTPAPAPEPAESMPPEPYPDIAAQLKAIEPLTLLKIVEAIGTLKLELSELSSAITTIREEISRKRKAVPNGKVQIKDTTTGTVYPSKNGTFKTLLNAGQLKDLVDQGIFGPDPKKNTFAWYALNRAFPGRFVEVKE